MTKTFFVSFFIILSTALFSQTIERKIIVQNGNYYFTTIDDNIQLATLYTGIYSSEIKDAKKLALPFGRNYDDPINPFCWDVSGKKLFAVNFLVHSQNDRNEAIKRIELSSLKDWATTGTNMEMIMKGVEMNPYTYNDPYLFVTRRSNTLDKFFFDGAAENDSSYTMAISNNGELSVWNFNGKEWKHGEVQKFPVDGYFSLFVFNKKTYMIINSGVLYEISTAGIKAINKDCGTSLTNGFIVINKDEKTISFLKNSDFNSHTTLNELINKKAIRIF